jgi:hypothetical protein
MGFNKRYISIESLKKFIENECSVSKIFEADALFFCDDKSSEIYDLYLKGIDDKQLKNIIQNEPRK